MPGVREELSYSGPTSIGTPLHSPVSGSHSAPTPTQCAAGGPIPEGLDYLRIPSGTLSVAEVGV